MVRILEFLLKSREKSKARLWEQVNHLSFLVFSLPLPGKRSFLSIKLSLINILRDGLYPQNNILLNLDHISERLEELKPSPEAPQYLNGLLKILHLSSMDGGPERSYWWSSETLLVCDLEGTREEAWMKKTTYPAGTDEQPDKIRTAVFH